MFKAVDGTKFEKLSIILAYLIELSNNPNNNLHNTLKKYYNLIYLSKLSMLSFAGKTLLNLDKQSVQFKRKFAQYQIMCIKHKSIFILNKYNNKPVIIKIFVDMTNFDNWLSNLEVFYIKEKNGNLYLEYDKQILFKDYGNLPERKIENFNTLSHISNINSIEHYTKLYTSLLKIVPNKYCHYCNANPKLKKSFNEESYLDTGILNYSGKGDICPTCKVIFGVIKSGLFNPIEYADKYSELDTENIIWAINDRCKKITVIDDTFPKQKRNLVGEVILNYSKIKKTLYQYNILAQNYNYSDYKPYFTNYIKKCKPKSKAFIFLSFIEFVSEYYGLDITDEELYFKDMYLNNFFPDVFDYL